MTIANDLKVNFKSDFMLACVGKLFRSRWDNSNPLPIVHLGSSSVALHYNDKVVAILRNPEIYYQRKEERCSRQFGTNNADHPYIRVRQNLIFLFFFF